MTTNKIIEIPFLNTSIQQQTDNGLINIKPVVDLVNEERKFEGKEAKEIRKYFVTEEGQEYVEQLLYDLEKLGKSTSYDYRQISSDSEKLSKINELESLNISLDEYYNFSMADLKSFEVYKKTRGKYEGTWFSPLLALDIVGWLSPKMRLQFNKIVLQELYKKRITISNKQRELTDTIVKVLGKPEDANFYAILGYEINMRVFGKSYTGIRNEATDEQYEALIKLLSGLSFMIANGLVSSHYKLISIIKSIVL